MYKFHTSTTYLFPIHFNIIFLVTTKLHRRFCQFRFFN